jgi:hypothetical protein
MRRGYAALSLWPVTELISVPVALPVPKSVQLAVDETESNVASTLLPELEIPALFGAVHVAENPLHVTVHPGFAPPGPAVKLSRLPDSCVLQDRLTTVALGLVHVPAVVTQLVASLTPKVSSESAPPGLTVPVPARLQASVKFPPRPPACEKLTEPVMVVFTDVLTLVPSTCHTVNAEADDGPMNAASTSADTAPSPIRVMLFIALPPS